MKKLLLILLAAALLPALAACGKAAEPETPEPPEKPVYEPMPESMLPLAERVRGDWYAGYEGLTLTLSLSEDGRYAFRFPGQEDRTGAWAFNDENYLCLDGEEGEALLPVGDTLRWASAGLLFTREKPEVYSPAALYTGLKEGDLDGYWKSHYVAVGEGTMFAFALGEKTDVYIEGTRVALGGPLFGDVIVDAALKDGALCYEAEGLAVKLALQEDGLLRLTASSDGEEDVTLYLLPAIPGWVEPEDAELESQEAAAEG